MVNKPVNCHKFVLWLGIILISLALVFSGYVEYQKRVHNLNLQIGHSLYPVVSDYFSWSKEETLKSGELPKRGEFYSYRRPESATKTPMEKFYQRLSGGRTATKQCHGVSEDGLLWDTGSDDKWVPTADIVGHVVEIYDSRYKELSETPEGRFRLWVERHNVKGDYAFVGEPTSYVAITEYKPIRTTVFNTVGKPVSKPFSNHRLQCSQIGITMLEGEISSEHFVLYYPDTGVIVDWVNKDGEATSKSVVREPSIIRPMQQ